MFRITATITNGHDVESIVFTLRAPTVIAALNSAMAAMRVLGFKTGDYDLANSINLATGAK